MDQINTLRIIIEQSLEFQSPVYAAFVDFDRAVDSMDREVMWKISEKCVIPNKIITIMKELYRDFECVVEDRGNLSTLFPVQTGVKQGCLLSPLLFTIVIDHVMRKVVAGGERSVQWGIHDRLEDLDFADDICLLSQRHQDATKKIEKLGERAGKIGLKINVSKTKDLRNNNGSEESLRIGDENIERVGQFCYLGSMVSDQGGTNEDVKNRLGKAKGAFSQLMPIRRSSQLSLRVKLGPLETNVKSVLLNGCET